MYICVYVYIYIYIYIYIYVLTYLIQCHLLYFLFNMLFLLSPAEADIVTVHAVIPAYKLDDIQQLFQQRTTLFCSFYFYIKWNFFKLELNQFKVVPLIFYHNVILYCLG